MKQKIFRCVCLAIWFLITRVDVSWAFPSTTVLQLTGGGQNLKYSPDGRLLAVAVGNSVLLLNAETLTQVSLLFEENGVGVMEFSPDGHLLVLGVRFGTFSLWDVQSTEQRMRLGEPRIELGGAKAATFSSDGRLLATLDHRALEIRDLSSMQTVFSRRSFGEERSTFTLLSTLNNRFIAIDRLENSPDDGVILWDVQTGKDLLQLEGSWHVFALSPDGKILATGSNEIKLWDLQTGTELRTLRAKKETDAFTGISSLTFCPDGATLASGTYVTRAVAKIIASGVVRLWDVQTGRLLKTLEGHSEEVATVAFSPDSKTVASVGRELKLWDFPSGKEKATLTGHPSGVLGAAFRPNGHLISGSGERQTTIIHWALMTGKPLEIFKSQPALRSDLVVGDMSRDGRLFALSAIGTDAINIWDTQTGGMLQSLQGLTRRPGSVVFSLDSTLLASRSGDSRTGDGTIRVWDVETWEVKRILTGQIGFGRERSIAFSRDNRLLASGSREMGVQLWELQTGRLLANLPEENFQALTFSPDGVRLASSGVDSARRAKNLPAHTIKIWDVSTGKLLRTMIDENGFIVALAFHPNGKILASGASNSFPPAVKLWEVETGAKRVTLPGGGRADTLVFSADGRYLATNAGGMRVWNLAAVLSPDFSPNPFVEKPLLSQTPQSTLLLQNYPNPFHPPGTVCHSGTRIPFVLGEDTDVTLTIYNLMGRLVRQFDLGSLPAGDYRFPPRSVLWNGTNALGEQVTSGVYFYTIEAGEFRDTRKMVIKK